MKTTAQAKNPFNRKKNGPKGSERLPLFYNTAKTANSSQGQSPYVSFRRSCKMGSLINKCQSAQDIRKSITSQTSQKKKEKQNKGKNKFTMHPQFSSCTQTPKNYQTQGNEEMMCYSMSRSNFKFMYQIGFGGFGKVWKVQEKNSWQYYAMKQIQKRKVLEKDSVDCIMNQKKVLSNLNHPFLVNIKYAFQDKNNLYLIMDYLKGADLRYHICYRQSFSQIQTKFILACLILAVQDIHGKGIVHRDIKPQNLVLQETGYVRLTDFGIAKYVKDLTVGKYDSSGTPGYMAPEVLMREQYSQVSDFFAVGVVGYELMLNKRPYFGKNRKQIKQEISKQQIVIKQGELPYGWNKQSADFINKLRARNPNQRLGSKEGIKALKEHPWMRDMNWKKLYKKQIVPPFIPNIVCETKDYLEQIQSYNQMNEQQSDKKLTSLSSEQNKLFEGYQLHTQVQATSAFVTPFRNIRNTLQKNIKIQARSRKGLKVF